MGQVIDIRPPMDNDGFLECPACDDVDGHFFPVCRSVNGASEVVTLVCAACGASVPVSNGYLMPPESREGA